MKEFKGTKGEWEFKEATEKYESYTICDFKIIGYAANNKEEDSANEKLRSAALDLLEALQNCLETFNILDDTIERISDHETYFNATRNSMEVAENAINKAL